MYTALCALLWTNEVTEEAVLIEPRERPSFFLLRVRPSPPLAAGQVALWLLPLAGVEAVHDHRLVGAAGCHAGAVAVWDVKPDAMRAMGAALRQNPPAPGPAASKSSLCVPELMAMAADKVRDESIPAAFGNGGHRFPQGHQVYGIYYGYFFALVRAHRWAEALEAWALAQRLAPAHPQAAPLQPLAAYLQRQMATPVARCTRCGADLAPVLDAVTAEQGRRVEVCSSVSGNVDSLDESLAALAGHIRSVF